MAPLPADLPPAPSDPPGIWRVGTLSYTLGGLTALFFLLLLGDFAWSMRDRSVGQLAQWYLSELKVPSVLFAVLTSSLPAVIALVLGPVISVRSDRHRGKWGRRIPYLLITTPIAVVGMVGLALSPFIAKWMHGTFASSQPVGEWLHRLLGDNRAASWLLRQTQDELIISVVCFAVFWTCFEFATIAGQSVFGGLVNDVVPVRFVGLFYGLFRAVSLIDGMIFNQWIFGYVADHYTLILISIGLFYGLCFMGVCCAVKEGEYSPAPSPPAGMANENALARFFCEIQRYLKECFSSSYYRSLFLLLMISSLTFIPVNTFNMQFSKSLSIVPQAYGHYFFLTYATSLALAVPLGWLCDLLHPLRMVMVTLALYFLVTLWGGFFATNAHNFLIALFLHGVISGCYYTCSASMANRLFPHSRFAQFSSAVVILGSLAGIILTPLLGYLFDHNGHIYRYSYLAGGLFSGISLLYAVRVHRLFMQLGGPKNYAAPE